MAIQQGQFVEVRGRPWLVEAVDDSQPDLTTLRLSCIADDAQGEQIDVLWDAEIGTRIIQDDTWAQVGRGAPDSPEVLAAYLRAIRWRSATAADRDLLQAPFRAGIRLDAYQLLPLRKALRLPRVNLLIADDVGLGKTVEAGLVVRELLLRRRIDLIVISAPPAMVVQWKDELESKFGLTFDIIDRERIGELRRQRGFSVNPWTTGSRFIVAHSLLTDEAYVAGLRDILGDFRSRALFILDEAHHAAPSGGARYAISSQLTRAVDDLARRFEHRLFLTATPHNGHSNSFSALLEMLDPQRFTRGVDVRPRDLEPVMVRRLKADLRRLGEAFPERRVEPIPIAGLPNDAPELDLWRRLAEYGALRNRRIAKLPGQKAALAKLAFVGLQQRLLSSIPAFLRTLKAHRKSLQRLIDGDEAQGIPAAAQAFVDGSMTEKIEDLGLEDQQAEEAIEADEDATAEAASVVGAADASAADLRKELAAVDEMLALAENAARRSDARVLWLVQWIKANLVSGKTWKNRRLIIFTEWEDTRRWLERRLREALAAAHWDTSKPGLPLFRQLVKDRVAEAMKGRAEIQAAPDDTARAIQEQRHKSLEARVAPIRTMGDAVIAAFFSADKAKAREKKRAEVESWLTGSMEAAWDKLAVMAATLKKGTHPLMPFHWEVEFPEVFARGNGGFDAIVGNPPFAGKNTIIGSNRTGYLPWLQTLHAGAHGNSDLVAHFFRRAFAMLRSDGVAGLIATNTIGQGDTRDTGLATIMGQGGAILRATRRLKWPGEAAVIVSVVHLQKGIARAPEIDLHQVRRISAYLVEGELDRSPAVLSSNVGHAFTGCYLLGMGFTFDDAAAAKGETASLADMAKLIQASPRNSERIFPYIGGEEINTDPAQRHRRFVIDFSQDSEIEARSRWPTLLAIVERYVRPERARKADKQAREKWWQFLRPRWELRKAIADKSHVLVVSRISGHLGVAQVVTGPVFSIECNIFAFPNLAPFAVLQCRLHEVWARFSASSMKDDLRYTPSDCFDTFPFPPSFEISSELEAAGQAYHDHRAVLMVARNDGTTKTYNRFHDISETSEDIQQLRSLHAAMDRAVLKAYGWHDLAARAAPIFLDETNEDDHTYQGRLFWPSDFRDEVLARLLALNAERHAEEVRLGIAPGMRARDVDDEDDSED